MPKTLNLKPKPVKSSVIESVCDHCHRLRSKQQALIVSIRGRLKFLCSECSDEFSEFFNLSYAERAEYFEWIEGGAA